MPISFRQVGPCLAAEVSGIDIGKPLTPAEVAAIHARHGQVRRAGVPPPADRRRAAARFHPQPRRDRGGDRHGPARSQRVPAAHDLRRRVQSRQGQQAVRPRRPQAAVLARQPAVAFRQLVQGNACEILAAAFAQRRIEGRQHRVRRHARGLRCARRGDQGAVRGPRVRAFAAVLARGARLHRVHGRGAQAHAAGAPVPGSHPPVDGAQIPLPLLPRRVRSSAGRCRRRATSCAISTRPPPSASSSTRTSGSWATSSCGTTARPCIACGRFPPTRRATCAAPRWPATAPPSPRRRPDRSWRAISTRITSWSGPARPAASWPPG